MTLPPEWIREPSIPRYVPATIERRENSRQDPVSGRRSPSVPYRRANGSSRCRLPAGYRRSLSNPSSALGFVPPSTEVPNRHRRAVAFFVPKYWRIRSNSMLGTSVFFGICVLTYFWSRVPEAVIFCSRPSHTQHKD